MIQSYKDLIVWQKAMQMTEMVYSMAKKTSEGGNVCPERPNEAGSGVDSFEHCRGLRAKFKERVHPIFVYSKRIWIRTGNTNDVGRSDRLCDGTGNFAHHEFACRNR